jgi:hypothetical protein
VSKENLSNLKAFFGKAKAAKIDDEGMEPNQSII